MATEAAGAGIDIQGAPNLRDLGGWAIAGGGRVRRRAVYRSAELAGLGPEGLAAFAQLGIKTIYDLRTTAERDAQPDAAVAGVERVHLDVFADAGELLPARPLEAAADPKAIAALLEGGKAEALLTSSYRQLVSLPSAVTAYRALFAGLAQADDRPALFHCTTGKDRTGWAAAVLLDLVGVDRDDIYTDYLLTNEQILPLTQPMYERFAAVGGDPALLRPVLGVEEAYLRTAFSEMEARYGSSEKYFSDGLGLEKATTAALRAALIA